jgi:hypothetical protein
MTLQRMLLHFRDIYGRANEHTLPSLNSRLKAIMFAACDLQDAVRKHKYKLYNREVARLISRIMAAADYFDCGERALVDAMSRKYPVVGCV